MQSVYACVCVQRVLMNFFTLEYFWSFVDFSVKLNGLKLFLGI